MRINGHIVTATSGLFTPVAMAFIEKSILTMLPWMMVMFMVIVTDLISGIRKCRKLKVKVRPTTAFRETFGKTVVYFAFVMMVAMIDVAANGDTAIAKWSCLLICALEGGSIISNILKPYGVVLSVKGILKVLLKRSPLSIGEEEADEIIKSRDEEDKRWNTKPDGNHTTILDKDNN